MSSYPRRRRNSGPSSYVERSERVWRERVDPGPMRGLGGAIAPPSGPSAAGLYAMDLAATGPNPAPQPEFFADPYGSASNPFAAYAAANPAYPTSGSSLGYPTAGATEAMPGGSSYRSGIDMPSGSGYSAADSRRLFDARYKGDVLDRTISRVRASGGRAGVGSAAPEDRLYWLHGMDESTTGPRPRRTERDLRHSAEAMYYSVRPAIRGEPGYGELVDGHAQVLIQAVNGTTNSAPSSGRSSLDLSGVGRPSVMPDASTMSPYTYMVPGSGPEGGPSYRPSHRRNAWREGTYSYDFDRQNPNDPIYGQWS